MIIQEPGRYCAAWDVTRGEGCGHGGLWVRACVRQGHQICVKLFHDVRQTRARVQSFAPVFCVHMWSLTTPGWVLIPASQSQVHCVMHCLP